MLKRFVITTATCAVLAMPAATQNLFATVVTVDDAVITEYEIGQRAQLLQVLGAPSAGREGTIEALIEDRLKKKSTNSVGLNIDAADLADAMSDFAERVNLSTEAFVKVLAGEGVSEQTFRDFVAINVLWRNLIRSQYGNRVQITEADIDRALGTSGGASSIRVLLSEIIIPDPAPKVVQAQAQAQAEQASKATSVAEFSSFARRFSATATRDRGGRLDWLPLAKLPSQLRTIILSLAPGEVTSPIPLQGSIALFQLRDIQETDAPAVEYSAIEYAAYYMAGGRSDKTLAAAEKLKLQIDVCDDLYGVAKGEPAEALDRGTLAPKDIPQDIAIELAKLDPGEVSTNLTRADGTSLVFLMMCGRTDALNEDIGRDSVSTNLRQQRLSGYADSLIGELRASARIVRK
ncbi:peptidylprolyl isomerase [Ascidiaceihabitans sp.]|nr:peptidylprolyl isomerase [Ascidiaceihabitans sp.]